MKKYLVSLLFILLIADSTAFSQNRLLGARQASLGGCGLTIGDVWAVMNNQAALAKMNELSLGGYYEDRLNIPDLSLKAMSLVVPTNFSTIGLSFHTFGTSDYSENKIGLALAKKLGQKFMMGIQLDYFLVDQPTGFGNAYAFTGELGLLYFPIDGLSIGAHLFNPSNVKYGQIVNQSLNQIARLGAEYDIAKSIRCFAEVTKNLEKSTVYSYGLEYDLLKNISLRYGYRTEYSSNSFGIGVHLPRILFDVAASQFANIGWNTHLGLQIQISKNKSQSQI